MQIVTEDAARAAVSMADAITAIADALDRTARGEAVMFPAVLGRGPVDGTRFSVKSGLDANQHLFGVKVGSYWGGNPARGLPAHGSTTLLLDETTGRPRALVSASYLNGLRTAAADAVAVKALSRPEASVVAIIGAGGQAWYDLLAISQVRTLTEARIWSQDGRKAEAFAERARAAGVPAKAVLDRQAAIEGADIIATITPSRAPLVEAGWVKPGAHISAMGADGPGKQELDVALVGRARVFADLPSQCAAMGELQHAVAAGVVTADQIVAIGDVIGGRAPGRQSASDITLFDSSGLAIQDLAIAELALTRAVAQGLAQDVDLYGSN